MGLTILWSIVRSLLTLAVAALVVSRSETRFEAAAFVAALIGYHRIGFLLDSINIGGVVRGVRNELWFHRLDYIARLRSEASSDFPPVLEVGLFENFRNRPDLFGEWEQLEGLKSELEDLESKRKVSFWAMGIVEVILMASLAVLLLVR